MNPVATADSLPDVQTAHDPRGVALDEVGVGGVALPLTILAPDGRQEATVAEADLSVALPAEVRGTHMSRFVEEAAALGPVTPGAVLQLARALRERLEAPRSHVQLRFPLFVERAAPVSGLSAPHRYEAWLCANATEAQSEDSVIVGVRAAVTSLCPCSREISDYGAHSQRGYVEVEVEAPGWDRGDGIWPQELFSYADGAGSAPIHPLLKRRDERAVTMLAYDQPAFVEDIAREVVLAVRADKRCAAWTVAVVNQESIHDHQAVARVRGRR
jgi:GTP cyclohydrolase FolE2